MERLIPTTIARVYHNDPHMSINVRGKISFNRSASSELGIRAGSKVALVHRPNGDKVEFAVMKDDEGFRLMEYNKNGRIGFGAQSVVQVMRKLMDLPLDETKRKSIQFSLKKTKWEGKEVWKIV